MAAQTIKISSCGRYEEALASGIFSPGHLLKRDSNGKVLKHATEGGWGATIFAQEDALQGKTVADAYAVGDMVGHWYAMPGDVFFAYLKAGVSYAVADQLISAGDGTLKKLSAASTGVTVRKVVGEVRDALNLSATGAVSTRTAVICY